MAKYCIITAALNGEYIKGCDMLQIYFDLIRILSRFEIKITMAQKKHGGKRNGAGRKPVKDKRVQLNIYPLSSSIKNAGGKKKAKELALNAIEPC